MYSGLIYCIINETTIPDHWQTMLNQHNCIFYFLFIFYFNIHSLHQSTSFILTESSMQNIFIDYCLKSHNKKKSKFLLDVQNENLYYVSLCFYSLFTLIHLVKFVFGICFFFSDSNRFKFDFNSVQIQNQIPF